MQRYGRPNDAHDDGDCVSNFNNAAKSCYASPSGHASVRRNVVKRRFRTIMNKRKRALLKRELTQLLIENDF